jgi:hypothetical protein
LKKQKQKKVKTKSEEKLQKEKDKVQVKKRKGLIARHIDLIKMWDDVYDEYRSRYNPERALASNRRLYMDSNFTYSKVQNVTAYYVVDELPPEFEMGYRATFRTMVPEGISMNFIEDNEIFELNWDDPKVKTRLSVLDEVSDKTQEEAQTTSRYNAHKYVKSRQKDERLAMSIDYANDATMSDQDKRYLYKVRVMIVITGQRSEEFTRVLKDFERMCEHRTGLQVRRVTGVIADTVSDFSPFSAEMTKESKRKIRSTFTSDELRAQWHPFEQGIVGYGTTYLGTNIETHSPVFHQFKRDVTDAEIVIILGMSGSGKSYLMKLLATQLAANDNMIMTINDYEGGEYKGLGVLLEKDFQVVSLDLGMGSGRYLDPVPLVPTGDEEMDLTLFTRSRKNVIDLFRAVAGGETLSTYPWIRLIIERGVDLFYSSKGVSQDVSTWSNLTGCSIYSVYDYLKEYRPSFDDLLISVTDEDKKVLKEEDIRELYKNALQAFQADRLYFLETFGSYFDKSKKLNNYFTKPVYLSDIIDAKLVICDYNMRGVPESQLSELDAILIPMNAATVAYYRTVYPFARGLYNVKIWEELQRFSSLPNAVEILKTPITGGRKAGDINIVASNDPAKLVEKDEYSLFANYTLAMVGKIKSPTYQERVCQALGIMDLSDELAEIGAVIEEDEGLTAGYDEVHSEPYKKAFILKLNSGESAVVKADLPKYLSDTPLFRTGVLAQAK